MSADNGYVIRKNWEGKFVLQMYFASADDYPELAEARPQQIFDTLEEAVLAFEAIQNSPEMIIEYGLSIHVSD